MAGVSRRRLLLAVPIALGAASNAARAQSYRILDATETVGIEHQDRKDRIRRATARLGIRPAPDFTETTVSARHLPENFKVDTPVLRVSFSERSFFDTAQTEILPTGQATIRALAEAIRGEAPDVAVFVAGHTDNRGGEPYNHNLSVGRANAVADTLFLRDVGEVALWRVGFGEAAPLYSNDSDEHMAFNRRVEFLFSARAEPILEVLKRQLDTVCVASSAEASDRCRRSLRVRSSFEAIQVTNRRMGVGLTPQRSSAAPAPPGRSRVSPAAPTIQAVAPATRRVVIDLRAQRYSLDTPTK